ncbi:hypothetical protein BC827DRAFT_1266596 [Russula dissimulans]|nr:hypothetical protein BC827DRAFT_1266596 [Russula dissimulans]
METTVARQLRAFDATAKARSPSTSINHIDSIASKPKTDAIKLKDQVTDTTAPDPAALRARLRRRAPPVSTVATPATAPEEEAATATMAIATVGTAAAAAAENPTASTTYDKVLDTARRLAELERQRAQDQAYIRTLEQARATLLRDAQGAARARAEAERAAVGEREARRERAAAEAARAEAERVVGVERGRAERAEARLGALEVALGVAVERVGELEGLFERERRCREEWESGLEALALGSSVGVS